MATADWNVLTSSLTTAEIDRGVTAGIAKPNGGGSFVYGFNSLLDVDGAAGLYVNTADFIPLASGGRITGAMKRSAGASTTGFSPMLFLGLQGTSVDDTGYLLGLSDANPSHIILKKGTLAAGVDEDTVGVNGVLAIGTIAVATDEWVHLRLDMVVNGNGDVVLNVFQNDLAVNTVSAPSWDPVPGITWAPDPATGRAFIDDALGVNSGSSPYGSGYAGFGFECDSSTRRAFFDHLTIERSV